MTYDISGTWRDDLGRPHLTLFSNLNDLDHQTTQPIPMDALMGELHRLREENQQLKHELRLVREQNTRLRERVGQSPKPGTSTLDDAAHTVLADRFRDLVQQDMQHLARRLLHGSGDRNTTQRVAWDISAICRELLTGQHDTVQTCLRLGVDENLHAPLVGGLIAKAKTVTDEVHCPRSVGFPCRAWRPPRPHPATRLGPVRGSPSIKFVVAPAYRINGRTYAPQLVYTSTKTPLAAVTRSATARRTESVCCCQRWSRRELAATDAAFGRTAIGSHWQSTSSSSATGWWFRSHCLSAPRTSSSLQCRSTDAKLASRDKHAVTLACAPSTEGIIRM